MSDRVVLRVPPWCEATWGAQLLSDLRGDGRTVLAFGAAGFGGAQDGPMPLFTFDPMVGARSVRTIPLRPKGLQRAGWVIEVAFSARSRRLAWFEELPAQPQNTRRFRLCTCRLNGREAWVLGESTTIYDSAPVPLKWLPDGRHLSFFAYPAIRVIGDAPSPV
jgi:hypothetical protein